MNPMNTFGNLLSCMTNPVGGLDIRIPPITAADCTDWGALRARVLEAKAAAEADWNARRLNADIRRLNADIAFVKRSLGVGHLSMDAAIAALVADDNQPAAMGLIDARDRLEVLRARAKTAR